MDKCPFTNKPCSHPKDIEITTKDGSNVQQLHLCQMCGISELAKSQLKTEIKTLVGMLFNLIDEPVKEQVKCPGCGVTATDIIKASRFGCPSCYTTHKGLATTIFNRCQDSTRHVGKIPQNVEAATTAEALAVQIANLEDKIKKAVEVENYEIAAMLKNKINELKRGGKSV